MATAIKHPAPDQVKPSFVIFDIRALTLIPERQSARIWSVYRMLNIGCLTAVAIW